MWRRRSCFSEQFIACCYRRGGKRKVVIRICDDVIIDVLAFLTRKEMAKFEEICRYFCSLIERFYMEAPFLLFNSLTCSFFKSGFRFKLAKQKFQLKKLIEHHSIQPIKEKVVY